MSISARSKIQGRVSVIQAGEVMSLVTVQAGDNKLVAEERPSLVRLLIEMNLAPGDSVLVVIKATEVMLLK
jgi:molybdopterin-binding protein